MPTPPDLRCAWSQSAPDYIAYHDQEWGFPVYDDDHMFEHLFLETFQAGLTWLLILRRRPAFRAAFHNLDPERIAKMTEADVERLSKDASIIRHRGKIRAAIGNAQAVVDMKQREGLGLAEYFWRWVGFVPVNSRFQSQSDLPSTSDLAIRISRDLKRRGFRFVGPTIVYAHLQATGIVNDHVMQCPQYKAVQLHVRNEEAWQQAGVVIEKMGDAQPFWDEMERQENEAKASRKRRKSKSTVNTESKGAEEKKSEGQSENKKRRSSRLANKKQ